MRRISHTADEEGQWWAEFESNEGTRYKAEADSLGHRAGHFADQTGKKFAGFIDDAGNRVRQFEDESGNALAGAMGWASHTWQDATRGMTRRAHDVSHAASGAAASVRHLGGDIGSGFQSQTDQLTRQIGSLFDQQPLDFLALRSGLMGHKLHAEDVFGVQFGVFAGFGHLYAAAFATAAGVNLRLDHDARRAVSKQLAGHVIGFFERVGHFAPGHRYAVLSQDFLCLILVNFHVVRNRPVRCSREIRSVGARVSATMAAAIKIVNWRPKGEQTRRRRRIAPLPWSGMDSVKELLKPMAEDGTQLTREQAAHVLEEILAGNVPEVETAALLGRGLMAGFRHYFLQSGGDRLGHVLPQEWQMSTYIPLAFFLPGFVALAVLAGERVRDYALSQAKLLGWANRPRGRPLLDTLSDPVLRDIGIEPDGREDESNVGFWRRR